MATKKQIEECLAKAIDDNMASEDYDKIRAADLENIKDSFYDHLDKVIAEQEKLEEAEDDDDEDEDDDKDDDGE